MPYMLTVSASFIPPCCPIPAKAVPIGNAWQHEVKFDGYRVQVHKTGKDVAIYSGNGHVFTPRFETIAYLLREVGGLDGEIVASDRRGVPKFARLHLSLVVGRWAAPLVLRLAGVGRPRLSAISLSRASSVATLHRISAHIRR